MLEKYNIANLKKAISNPYLVRNQISIFAKVLLLSDVSPYYIFHKYMFKTKYANEELIMDKDWDILILLDACRYDTFEEINTIDGCLEKYISAGSHSKEFAEKNFQGKKLYDTVYVTANAYGARIGKGDFHDIVFTEKNKTGNWATRKGMHPKNVAESAFEVYEQHPNKRLIIHFMQPHSPYFGETAQELRSNLSQDGVNDLGSSQWEVGPNLKLAAKNGHISIPELNKVYKENLHVVLEYVKCLIKEFEGKIVISSDHGELLGEQTGFWKYTDVSRQTPSGTPVGHPQSVYVPELRVVPWLVINSGSRRKIISETPNEQQFDEELIEDRLSKLGYK